MSNRPGCLVGLLELLALSWLFDWLQDTFGFGKGCSCTGCGCGLLLFIIFITLACSVIFGTNWLKIIFDISYNLV